MFHQAAFIRALAIPVCLLWGLVEFMALQRVRFLGQRSGPNA